MEKKISLLLFNLANQLIGLDSTEIYKVVLDLASLKDDNLVEQFKKQRRYYNLWEMYKINRLDIASSFLFVKQETNADTFLIEAPMVSTIKAIDISQIMIVPEYIRKKQDPFFVWGLVKHEANKIMLITFNYFKQVRDIHG